VPLSDPGGPSGRRLPTARASAVRVEHGELLAAEVAQLFQRGAQRGKPTRRDGVVAAPPHGAVSTARADLRAERGRATDNSIRDREHTSVARAVMRGARLSAATLVAYAADGRGGLQPKTRSSVPTTDSIGVGKVGVDASTGSLPPM
jgi:hypothetical protein